MLKVVNDPCPPSLVVWTESNWHADEGIIYWPLFSHSNEKSPKKMLCNVGRGVKRKNSVSKALIRIKFPPKKRYSFVQRLEKSFDLFFFGGGGAFRR